MVHISSTRPGGQPGGILEVGPVVVHALLHVPEHVAGAVRRRGIGAEADIGSRLQQLGNRAAAEDRRDRARIVGNAGSRIGDDPDLVLGEVRGVREEGIRSQNPEFLRIGDAALRVPVLREDETGLACEVGRHARLALGFLQIVVPEFVEVLGAQRWA